MAGRRIRLRGVGGPVEGMFWESDKLLRIGRYENLELVVNDPSISRRHSEVVASEEGWVVRDMGSTNGTFLNGVRVGRTDRKVRQRDVIQCGNIVMVVALCEDDLDGPEDTESGGLQVQATTSNSWERALETAAFTQSAKIKSGDRLLALLRASHHLVHTTSTDDLLRSILDDTVKVLSAQRAAIVLYDDKAGQLALRAVSTGSKSATSRINFSRSIAQRCYERSESILCRDVNHAPEIVTNSIADGTMSSIICALLRSPRKQLGILHLDRGPLQEPFTAEDLHLADALAASVSAGIECAQLIEKQRDSFLQTVTALAQAVEMRDEYTGGHTQRVTDYSMILAEELKLPLEDRHLIQMGTPLHDIGKIGIDDSILRKPTKLTPEEFAIMKTHTVKGAQILQSIPDLAPIIPIVRNHHEQWNGEGYPDNLKGKEIPLLARIVAVADAFDAMTTSRPYRTAMSVFKAFEEIKRRSGTQFDPEIAAAFLRQRERIEDALSERQLASPDKPLIGPVDPQFDEIVSPPTAMIQVGAAT